MNLIHLEMHGFTAGDKHPAINSIKMFLNRFYAVSESGLVMNTELDPRTQAALSEYQCYKRVKPTGNADRETLALMKQDMSCAELKLASLFDPFIMKLFQDDKKKKPWRDITPILDKIIWIDSKNNYDAERLKNKDRIWKRIVYMFTPWCNEAYKNAGLPNPEETITEGLAIGARPLLTNSSYNDTLGITEENRKIANKSTAPALTILRKWTKDKISVILFSGDAFVGRDYLDESVAHEFIHAAGIEPHFHVFGNDLTNYKHYNNIIKNCGYPIHEEDSSPNIK